jgi:excisionase family DNA binding protein
MSTMLNLDYLTTQEAADIIGVTDGRVRQMRRNGTIQAIKVGIRTFLIPRSEAEKFAQKRTKVGRPRSAEKKSSQTS